MDRSAILAAVAVLACSVALGAMAQRPSTGAPGAMANPPPVAVPQAVATPAPAPVIAHAPNAPSTPTTSVAPGAIGAVGPATSPVGADQSYVLGAADVIEVSVLGRPEYTTRSRINEDGTVQLQYLGAVPAANRTVGQLSDDVARALEKGGFFAHPIVRVDVASYASRYVTVLGDVTTPGLVPVDRAYRLSEIVARVGGVRETGADYVILRPLHGPERRIAIATLATGDLADDPYVSPGDKIYSPAAEVFYISGQIKVPGAYPIIPDMTVRMALSRAGGLTDSGSEKGVTITRKSKKLTHVDLDSRVYAGDVIVIRERLF